MQFFAGIFAGIAASAIFWLLDRYLFTFSMSYQVTGMVICFLVFGGVGFWLASKGSQKVETPRGTRIASGLRGGRDVKITVDGVITSGDKNTDVLSDVDAKRDIEGSVRDIETKS